MPNPTITQADTDNAEECVNNVRFCNNETDAIDACSFILARHREAHAVKPVRSAEVQEAIITISNSTFDKWRTHELTLLDYITQLEAAEHADGWQDISTAPKDGTKVLLFQQISPEHQPRSDGIWLGEWSVDFNRWNCGWEPTHWMPVPPPANDNGGK